MASSGNSKRLNRLNSRVRHLLDPNIFRWLPKTEEKWEKALARIDPNYEKKTSKLDKLREAVVLSRKERTVSKCAADSRYLSQAPQGTSSKYLQIPAVFSYLSDPSFLLIPKFPSSPCIYNYTCSSTKLLRPDEKELKIEGESFLTIRVIG